MTCPHCQKDATAQPVGFTWWGGMIGAKLLNHVECTACRGRYNGKTGLSNRKAIGTYMLIVGVFGFALIWTVLTRM